MVYWSNQSEQFFFLPFTGTPLGFGLNTCKSLIAMVDVSWWMFFFLLHFIWKKSNFIVTTWWSHGFSYHSYADDTQLILSFPQSETQGTARISACLTDISPCMSAHHLKISLDKTELFFLPGKDSPTHDLTITSDNSLLAPIQTARNLGVSADPYCQHYCNNLLM